MTTMRVLFLFFPRVVGRLSKCHCPSKGEMSLLSSVLGLSCPRSRLTLAVGVP